MDDSNGPDLPVCLVLAPFGGTWGAVHAEFERRLEADGVSVRWFNARAELDKPVATAAHQYLEQADVIVADITDANPNVMYELGFAYALGKPVLPVVERQIEEVPPVVRGRLFVVYDRESPTDAIEFLSDWVGRHIRGHARVEELVG